MRTDTHAPDLEDLAAFVDGRLSGERKARVEKRLLRDEGYYEVFLETVRFQQEQGQEGDRVAAVVPIARWRSWRVAAPLAAQDAGTASKEALEKAHPKRPYSPYAGGAIPNRVFWGDTHLHTGLSMDAGLFGARLGLDEAYRFARGEEVMASSGQPVRLGRPLDWLPFLKEKSTPR